VASRRDVNGVHASSGLATVSVVSELGTREGGGAAEKVWRQVVDL
jgi:hypothetical protein